MKPYISQQAPARGMTYVSVVLTLVVVGTVLAAYLTLVGVQNQLSVRSQTWNRSVPVLEAGIEEAIAHLNKNGSPDSSGVVNLAKMQNDGWNSPGNVPTGPWYKFGYVNGDLYEVKISSWEGTTNNFPTISSTGSVYQLPAYAFNRSRGLFLAAAAPRIISSRIVDAATTNTPTFKKGVVAKHGIDMKGNNVMVDSYDSTNPLYSSNRQWHITKRRDRGDVASNDTITNTLNVANANIYGRVATGPNGTVYIGPNGSVGDLAWHASSSKGIKPGWSTDDMNVEFPDVELPANCGSWYSPTGGPSSYVLTSGDYRLTGTVGGQITVRSNANVRLYIEGELKFSGQEGLTIETNATIKIFLDGASADISGNGIINSNGTPVQCQIFGTSKLRNLSIGGNGRTTAAVYVPYATVNLNGGGNPNNPEDFSGALIGKNFNFNGHYSVHYDEALARLGPWRGFAITSWNEK